MATVKEIIRNDAVRLFPDKLLETEENVDDAMILAKMHCEAAAEGRRVYEVLQQFNTTLSGYVFFDQNGVGHYFIVNYVFSNNWVYYDWS